MGSGSGMIAARRNTSIQQNEVAGLVFSELLLMNLTEYILMGIQFTSIQFWKAILHFKRSALSN